MVINLSMEETAALACRLTAVMLDDAASLRFALRRAEVQVAPQTTVDTCSKILM